MNKLRKSQIGTTDTNVTNTAPTVNDDASLGYDIGSKWFDETTSTLYVCTDATVGAAVWDTATGGSVITVTNTSYFEDFTTNIPNSASPSPGTFTPAVGLIGLTPNTTSNNGDVLRINSQLNHPGIIALEHTDAVGEVNLRFNSLDSAAPNQGVGFMNTLECEIEVLIQFKTSILDTRLGFGLQSVENLSPTTGIANTPGSVECAKFFLGASSTDLTGNTSAGSLSTTTPFTPVVDTWYKLKIVSDGTDYKFYIDNSLLGTLSTNISTEEADIAIGVGNGTVWIDYLSLKINNLVR